MNKPELTASVYLAVFDWHVVLKILEHEMNTVNASRFTGIPSERVQAVFQRIAMQLDNLPGEGEE